MQTISQAVWSVISSDQVALEYLTKGLLNSSAYAEQIRPQIEHRLTLKVTTNSIVTALSRLRQTRVKVAQTIPKFKIDDLSFKLPITELVFKKDHDPNPMLAKIYEKLEKINNLHLNIVNVTNELNIFVSSSAAGIIKNCLKDFELILQEERLSALVLKYDSKFRNYPGMGSQILHALAVNSIIMVECLTTYSEFIIYIKQAEANKAVELLSRNFMS